jgi:hypothetical protein
MTERELSTSDLAGASTEAAPASDEPERTEAPAAEAPGTTVQEHGDDASEEERAPLLPDDQSEGFVTRWREIQVGFVDEPRESVAQADALVADLMQRLAAGFSDERQRLEAQWDRGDDVSTEDLRVALRRYRGFFDRLLSA